MSSTKKLRSQNIWRLIWLRFIRNKMALLGFFIICLFVLIALSADLISQLTGIDPTAQEILNRYGPRSATNLLGTDEAGRDVLMRLIYGTRISLIVAFSAAFASMLLGISIGTLAGYFGGAIDHLLMRVTDAFLALPIMPVLIILAAVDFQKIPVLSSLFESENSSILKMIFIFVSFSWMTQARLVRGAILSIKELEYVQAAQSIGANHWQIITKQILPNVLAPVVVSVTINVGQSILFESALSFLGLGVQPPTPTWGNMLNNALEVIYSAPTLVIIPGFFIFLIVVAFNFLGDGLQDALDPKAT